jgi:hypothetical protein
MRVIRSALQNRTRWRAAVGGLLVAVMLSCPLLCRAGACCSGRATASASQEVEADACPYCQQERQEQRERQSRVPPLGPRKPVRVGGCLCSGATVPVVVSAPEQRAEAGCHLAGLDSGTGHLSGSLVGEAPERAVTAAGWGRRLCVTHCVLIC